MSLKDLASDDKPIKVSFEFSPPKTAEAEEQLWRAIRRLEPLSPAFVSVTYGAGGSTRERTHATVKRVVEETSLSPAAHLTCVAAPRREIDEIVQAYWDAGVRHIVALRGDMPDMSGTYTAHPQGYASTPELIEGIRRIGDFEVSVSCYPERHPDSPSRDHDLALLRKKIDAGASRAIGQFCFRQRIDRALPRPCRGARHRRADHSRSDADDEFQGRSAHGADAAARACRNGCRGFTTASTAIPKAAAPSPPP